MKKSLLITGDDGYKAIGLRVLASLFKDDYDVTIVATKVQQSGAGGSTKAFGTKQWGKETIEGVTAYWVDGTPADSMEFATGIFPIGVDYLISGINWGENIGLSTFTASGTGGAALRAYTLGISPHVVIMSWQKKFEADTSWSHDTADKSVEDYIDYPGSSAKFIFNEILKNDFFGKQIVNVNFPKNKTFEYKKTTLLQRLTKFYKYPVIVGENTYSYEEEVYANDVVMLQDQSIDAAALTAGFISVTPVVIS